jgi:tetratricopeptide (TPR) repeat protein
MKIINESGMENIFKQIEFLRQSKKLKEAADLCADAISKDNCNPELWNILACILFEGENYYLSIALFKIAIHLNSNNAKYYYNLGVTLLKTKRYDEALDNLNLSLKIDSNYIHPKEQLNQYYEETQKDNSAFCVSYPKCGRNWFRFAFIKSLRLHYNEEGDEFLFDDICDKFKIPNLYFVHDAGDWGVYRESKRMLPEEIRRQLIPDWKGMKYNKHTYSTRKVIFIVRNPLDVLISSYFQIKNICQCYDGNLSEFILDPHFGIRKIISFYDMWNKHSLETGDFLLIRYEEMKKDLFRILKNSLSFLGIEGIKDESIATSCELSEFSKMKKIYSKHSGNPKNPEAQKIRKGKVFGFYDYLSDHEVRLIYEIIQEMGCPYYDFSYENGKLSIDWPDRSLAQHI